ncbi:YveK family protein [Enterococcus sp. AZ196]|uniref:YveK family protein n=1 Tax=Enterococcus sp. AZ196 TaxID=2774659 RepID=UPI003D27899C
MEDTLRLNELFQILKKNLRMILGTTIVGIVIAAITTFFLLTPKYDSSAQMIVQNKQAENGNGNLQNDINGNVLMVNTYKDMIKGDIVIDAVQKNLQEEYQYTYSNKELKEMIEVEQTQNSQMFQIIATSSEPRKAATIANVTATTFQEIAEEVLEVTKVTITSKGVIPTESVFPNNLLNLLIGALLGVIVGVVGAFISELLDDTVKDRRFVSENLDFPILGAVSEIDPDELIANRGTMTPEQGNVKRTLATRTVPNRHRERL